MSKDQKISSAREQARAIAQKSSKQGLGLAGKIGIGVGVVVLAAALVIGIIFLNQSKAPDFSSVNTPEAAQEYGVKIGAERKPVDETPEKAAEVVIYQDYNCPACGQFETANEEPIDKILDEGLATIEYRSLGMLDASSMGTNYSSRAANAMLCTVQESPDTSAVYELNKLLYANQPQQGTKGLDNDHLIKLAKSAGADDISDCVEEGTYRGYVRNATEYAMGTEKIEGTPTVLIDGEKWDLGGDLYADVKAAATA